MVEKRSESERFNWRLPFYVTVGATITLLSLMVYSADGRLLYVLLIAPIICLICLVLLISTAILRRPRECLSALLTLIAFVAASGVLLKNQSTLRPSIRWLLWSHHFKAAVLSQPKPDQR